MSNSHGYPSARTTVKRKRYVYTVTMHYDSYDHYTLGIAETLPIAKRLAQKEYTKYELPDVAPTLTWESRTYTYTWESRAYTYTYGEDKETRKYWVANRNAYGAEYHIDKQEVITS